VLFVWTPWLIYQLSLLMQLKSASGECQQTWACYGSSAGTRFMLAARSTGCVGKWFVPCAGGELAAWVLAAEYACIRVKMSRPLPETPT